MALPCWKAPQKTIRKFQMYFIRRVKASGKETDRIWDARALADYQIKKLSNFCPIERVPETIQFLLVGTIGRTSALVKKSSGTTLVNGTACNWRQQEARDYDINSRNSDDGVRESSWSSLFQLKMAFRVQIYLCSRFAMNPIMEKPSDFK